jgi:hypothetical protein
LPKTTATRERIATGSILTFPKMVSIKEKRQKAKGAARIIIRSGPSHVGRLLARIGDIPIPM